MMTTHYSFDETVTLLFLLEKNSAVKSVMGVVDMTLYGDATGENGVLSTVASVQMRPSWTLLFILPLRGTLVHNSGSIAHGTLATVVE